jgi:DNA-binding transcriptional LysR family regulator
LSLRDGRGLPKAREKTKEGGVVQAVLDGVGIGTAMEDSLEGLIAEGRLVQVLKDWCPSFPGYFLYYPSRRNQPAALAALIDALRLV